MYRFAKQKTFAQIEVITEEIPKTHRAASGVPSFSPLLRMSYTARVPSPDAAPRMAGGPGFLGDPFMVILGMAW
jgi:hypothetical protein